MTMSLIATSLRLRKHVFGRSVAEFPNARLVVAVPDHTPSAVAGTAAGRAYRDGSW
jgi:hypothetical protein